MRSTLTDVAREAGVSGATVDRVLNGRPGVRARTRQIVLETASRLGYIASPEEGAPRSGRATGVVDLDFVLPAGHNNFILLLARELERQAAARPDIRAKVHLVEGFNPDTLARKLDELDGRSGVGVIGIDHPTVRDAIRRLARSGTQIVTLVSDIQNVPRFGYVGIDNRSAGRLAGYIMSRFLGEGPHSIALFAGSIAYRGHEEREMGFRHIVSEHPDQLQVVSFSEVQDDDEKSYAQARWHLRVHPDISAIYNIGGGNQGIARALTEIGRAGDVVFIGHDLTDDTRGFLLSGTMDAVIDQYPRVEAREALEQLARAVRGQSWSAHPLRTQIILKENLPEEVA
ncbi:MAG: LacI family DNA-binding transcriptional regulator [Devosia sp.]|nr:LacI family DNA-binding transcriptional regulator [Devosia sp.]